MLKKILVFGLFSSLIIGCVGCGTLSKKDKAARQNSGLLEPQLIARFNDLPVPAGFKIIAKESYSFENSGMRVALLKYSGKANPDQVTNFYKEQMLIYGWQLLNIVEYGQRLLNFQRENETCIINLSGSGNRSTLVISLGPKNPAAIKKAERVVK